MADNGSRLYYGKTLAEFAAGADKRRIELGLSPRALEVLIEASYDGGEYTGDRLNAEDSRALLLFFAAEVALPWTCPVCNAAPGSTMECISCDDCDGNAVQLLSQIEV